MTASMEDKIQVTKSNDKKEDLSLGEEQNEDFKSFEEILIEDFEREGYRLSCLLHGNRSVL